jgi:hypothetical protein
MEKKRRVVKKEPPKIIEITEGNGDKKKLGKYFPTDKIFQCVRNRPEHFMRKLNSWGMDAKVVDFLVQMKATVEIKDSDTKWVYLTNASTFKAYGVIQEHKDHRPQYFLELKHWTVTKAKGMSQIIECKEINCSHNFSLNCLSGVVKIGDKGDCVSYEDRQKD